MKRLLFLLAFCYCCCSATAATETSLGKKWSFRTDPLNAGLREAWYAPGFDRSGWDEMEVPGCWNTRLEYAEYTGAVWYATTFALPQIPTECNILLDFEAVYADAEVWLNGEHLGRHDFGFTSFKFDITDRIATDTLNKLVVRVENSFKLGATWNWGGIRRPVTLRTVSRNRIENVFVSAEPDLEKGSAEVGVKVLLHGTKQDIVRVSISDSEGHIAARGEVHVAGRKEVLVPLRIRKVRLWDFDHPHLYTVTAVCDNGDPVTERFGIRKIEIDGYHLRLNGESVRLNGANWVPYDPFHGNTLPPEIYRRDIDRMKSCGVNMARLSHLALPKDVLDYLDEKGMLIFEEIPIWNKNHFVKANHPVPMRWLTELITQRYNHPCIIGWSAGNEIGRLSDNPDIEGYLTSAFRHIRTLDSTRLAVYVTHTAVKQYNEPVLLSDIILFNQYGAHGERADEVHRRYPGKPIFYSEYGSKVNSEDPNNTISDYAAMLSSMRGREYLIGASVWTFNDYRTNYRDNSTAATGNRPWGVVDVYGSPKRGFRELQRQNSPLAGFDLTLTENGVELTLIPRERLDLPAFRMEGYTVQFSTYRADGSILQYVVRPLPVIRPGDNSLSLQLSSLASGATKICAKLISPTGYVVHDVVQSLTPPATPVVTRVESGQDIIRIWFDRSSTADEWYARYGIGQLKNQSIPTIDGFIELPNLEYGKEYQIQLVAVNNAGETPAAEIVRARTRAAELPPIIRHLTQEGRNIQVGYTCDFGDFCYEFEYGTAPDKLVRHILTTVTGACNLPVIELDAQHFLRIRKRLRYGYTSDWSPVYSVNTAQ